MKNLVLTLVLISVCLVTEAQYNKDIIIEPVLKTDTSSIGQRIFYPKVQDAEVTILKITIHPGKSTGWHKHDYPVFAYILKGTLTVEFENKKTIQFSENSSFSEVINTLHNGMNKGNEDLVLIAFYLGEKGKTLSVPKENIFKK